MRYGIILYEGSIEECRRVIAGRSFQDKEMFGKEFYNSLRKLLADNDLEYPPYLRIAGPFAKQIYSIDFGSHSKFVRIMTNDIYEEIMRGE